MKTTKLFSSFTKTALVTTLVVFVSTSLLAQEKKAPPPFAVKIENPRADALYKVGEKILFSVSLVNAEGKTVPGKKIRFIMEREASPPIATNIETAETPLVIETSMDRPGFVLAIVYAFEVEPGVKTANAYCGVGVEVEKIRPGKNAPADFDEFWKSQKTRLAKVPYNATMRPLPPLNASLDGLVEAFEVKVDCVDGVPVQGYYARPAKAKPKSCGAVLSLHGAGVRSSSRFDGRVGSNWIGMDINAHGIDNGKSAEYYKDLETNALSTYRSKNNDDREKNAFNPMFLRVLRGLEFLKAQPEWNGKVLIAWGGSQGGAQSVVAAALDPEVSACYSFVTAMCNHNGFATGDKVGWPRWVQLSNNQPINPAVSDAAQYYDMCHFAARIKVRTFVNVGFIDTTCPPSSVYAMYNSLAGPKKMRHDIPAGHSVPPETTAEATRDMNEYMKNFLEGR